MSKNLNELDDTLAGKLRLLDKVSPLNPEAISEERTKFLLKAAALRAVAVERPSQRQAGGLQGLFLALQGKQRLALSNVVMALALVLALVMGSTGATVFAAQGSLPNELLYPVKTLSEDARLVLTVSSTEQLELMLDYSNRRLDEIAQLRSQKQPIPDDALVRTQEQLDAALMIAAELSDQQLVQALGQIRNQAETQSEQMTALMAGAAEVDPSLEQLRMRLQAQAEVAAEGEINPAGFRETVQTWTRERWRQSPGAGGSDTNPDGSKGNGDPGNQPTVTPGQYGPGDPENNHPPVEGEPENGSGTTDNAAGG